MRKRQNRPGAIGGFWLSRRGNSPAWCRTWFDNRTRQTQRVSLGSEDFEQAQLLLAEWVLTHGKVQKEKPQDVTLARVLARHYELHGSKLASADAVRHSLSKWNDFFAGELVADVTPARQRDFVTHLRAEGLSDGYIRRILADGKAAFNRAHREGELLAVPHVALVAEAEPREMVATIQEVAALFRVAGDLDHFRAYMVLALGTAARPAAILQLKASQVDIESRIINLNQPGRRQTKKRRPAVPICDTLLPFLASAPAGHLVQWTPKPPAGTQRRREAQPRPLNSIRPTFARVTARAALAARQGAARNALALRAAGDRVGAWKALRAGRARAARLLAIGPYVIRHTVATELRRRGVPVWEVAGLLGHSSGYKTTERYAKFGPDHLSGVIRALENYFVDLRQALAGTPLVPVFNHPERVSCVLPGLAPRGQPLEKMVELDGIEPTTSTMPL